MRDSTFNLNDRTPETQRFVAEYLVDLDASQGAIECADQVIAKIKQEPQDAIDVVQLAESMRAEGLTIEDMLEKIGR